MLQTFKSAGGVLAEKAAVRAYRYMQRHELLAVAYRQVRLAQRRPPFAAAGWTPHLCPYEVEGGRIVVRCPGCRWDGLVIGAYPLLLERSHLESIRI